MGAACLKQLSCAQTSMMSPTRLASCAKASRGVKLTSCMSTPASVCEHCCWSSEKALQDGILPRAKAMCEGPGSKSILVLRLMHHLEKHEDSVIHMSSCSAAGHVLVI